MKLNMNPVRVRPRRGFTLVELLVVVGIIAALIAILLPALSKVFESAKIASTKATLSNFLNACDSFQIDEQRLPGHFSQTVMGKAENGAAASSAVGLTSMENALIDLAGGIIPNEGHLLSSTDPAAVNQVRNIGPFLDTDDPANLKMDLDSVGTGELGGGYFSSNDSVLAPIQGQYDSSTNLNPTQMLDLIDPWGQPIMLWVRDEGAQGVPSAGEEANFDYVALEDSDEAGLGSTGRSLFYWATNCGYLRSDVLGESAINQAEESIIGSERIDTDWEEVQRAMSAILGSPSYPAERAASTDPWRPAEARGSIIAISAGPDGVYFKKGKPADEDHIENKIYYAPSGGIALEGDVDAVRTLESFDDLISSTGG